MFGAFWQTHTSCVDYCEFSSLVSASSAAAVISKADWWHSNMVKGSIVYWFKSRFLHITFLFFVVFFRIDFASLLIYLYSAVDGALCSYSNRLSLSVSHGATSSSKRQQQQQQRQQKIVGRQKKEKKMNAGIRSLCFVRRCRRHVKMKSKLSVSYFICRQFGNGWCMQRWAMREKQNCRTRMDESENENESYSRRKSNKFYQIKKNSSFPSQNGWHIYRTASANKRRKFARASAP